jgi:PAS domain-containing protein
MTNRDSVNTGMLQTVFDAMPSLIFVVDEDVRIQEYNAAAAEFLLGERTTILKRRAGDVLHCLHSTETTEGCGHAPFCKECIVRNSVTEAFLGERVVRKRTKIEILREDNKIEIYALITASPFQYKGGKFTLLIVEDISELTELQRIIPICSFCKKIRDEKETWAIVELYFKEHWDVDFSHGICPKCMEKHYPEYC